MTQSKHESIQTQKLNSNNKPLTSNDMGSYLIIDWGTSNFRAFLMNDSHQILTTHQQAMGLLHVQNNDFAQALQSVLAPWIGKFQTLPIYMAGMVGSANGWTNVEYVSTPVSLASLAKNIHSFELPWGAKAHIIPGVKHALSDSSFDVMRGEEVQAFGAMSSLAVPASNLAGQTTLILPGTHSKHVTVKHNTVTELKTYMTGELFSIITQYSILGKDLPDQQKSNDVFLLGVVQSESCDLTNALFSARTHLLFHQIAAIHVHEFISGLLIGCELNTKLDSAVTFVGSDNLCERYLLASRALNINANSIDGDTCFLKGMTDLIFNQC